MRTAGGSQRAAWGARCSAGCRTRPRRPREEQKGPRHPSLRAAPRAHIWRRPRAKAAGRFSLLWSRASRLVLIPGEAPPQARTPGASGHPHLENRTVPCSSGLRLTARQLCRISSGSGRSILAQGHGKQGWDPPGAGTVTARAAPSPG